METVTRKGFTQVVHGDPLGVDGGRQCLWANVYGRWYKLSDRPSPAPADFPIMPAMIADVRQLGHIGRMECETFSAVLVRFARRRGGWMPFTDDEFAEFADAVFTGDNLSFFVELGHLVFKNDRYHYSIGFIVEMWEYSRIYCGT